MGSSKQPDPPQQPSTAEGIKAWADTMPQVYETQMKYAPLEAAQQVQLAQQYAQPYGEAMLTAQKAMYPEEYALREELMAQGRAGMESGVPDWQKQQYQSDLNANMGTNVGSGIGADYMSRGLLQQNQDWKNYYRNLSMSLSGSQPVYQATQPSTSNFMSSYSPSSVLNSQLQGYGTAMSGYNARLGNQGGGWGSALGSIGGGAAGGIGAGMGASMLGMFGGGAAAAGGTASASALIPMISAKGMTLMCFPEGAEVDTKDGKKRIELISVGDEVIGGKVKQVRKELTGEDFVFCDYVTADGELTASRDHPICSKIISMKVSDTKTDYAYDILTDSGFYSVNNIRVGSTIKEL